MSNAAFARAASTGPVDSAYLDEITMMLRDLLRQVIRVREPRVLAIIDEPANASALAPELIEPALQVIGMWLQLLNIAEENAAMRNRRQMETRSGPDQVVGSFSHAFATVAMRHVLHPLTTVGPGVDARQGGHEGTNDHQRAGGDACGMGGQEIRLQGAGGHVRLRCCDASHVESAG